MKKTMGLMAALALAMAAGSAAADSLVIVPGKAAGYLYTQTGAEGGGSEDDRISLAVFKQGGFHEYQVESDPVGFSCDENCSERAQKVPAGQVTLRIKGNKPVPGVEIPLKGKWEGDCDDTVSETDMCVINLHELNAQVRVTVSPTVDVGTVIPLPEGGEALFVSMDTVEGYMLVAGRDNLGSARTWLTHDASRTAGLGLSNAVDGRENMQRLVSAGSQAAQYCQGLGNGWYLPARQELSMLTSAALQKVSGSISSGLWSSTEYKFKYETKEKDQKYEWEYEVYYLKSSASSSSTTAYKYKMEKGKLKDDYTYSYQVLCFRRLPI